MPEKQLPYDREDKESILAYARKLEGKTLRQVTGLTELDSPKQRRGSFGNAVETHYFQYAANSDSAPDFAEVGLELKTTPIKATKKGKLVAKERLVIAMIDFNEVVHEDFEHSHLLDKASDILLVSYRYEEDKDPLDYQIEVAREWRIPERDLPQIKHDWETVVSKVRAGHAEDISSSDTIYLEACTKGANGSVTREQPFSKVRAKPRAWALKASYMTVVQGDLLNMRAESIERDEQERDLGLLELVRHRFSRYFGMTQEDLTSLFGISVSKNACARVTKCILGVSEDAKIEEFEKAGIKPKTIRLKANGRPKEAISFPAFDYFDVAQTSFEDSGFFELLQQKYLFVLFREDSAGDYRLSDVCFWQMPESDYPEARRCYEQMQENIRNGRADISVKSTENRCCHVRPHGLLKTDTNPQPFGPPVTKKCFWLNQPYLKDEIARSLEA